MQHGSARPLAVKYITVQGRRHSDHGEPLSRRFRLMPGSEAAPEALKVRRATWQRGRRARCGRFLAGQLLVQRLVRPRLADGVVVEEHQPLQIDFLDAGVGRDAHEIRQFLDGLAQARSARPRPAACVALALLQLAEGAHVLQDAVEIILAADGAIGFRHWRRRTRPAIRRVRPRSARGRFSR